MRLRQLRVLGRRGQAGRKGIALKRFYNVLRTILADAVSRITPAARFRVRPLRRSDCGDLIKNYFSYYDELRTSPDFGIVFYRKKPSYHAELKWFESLYRSVSSGNTIASVAEADGKAVGLCQVTRLRPGSEVDHVAELGIAIIRGYRSIGAGSALIRDVLRRGKGFETVKLSVFSSNTAAKRLYRRMGFRKYGTFRRSIKRGGRYVDEDLMRFDRTG